MSQGPTESPTRSQSPVLEVRHVHKRFGSLRAVDDVSVTLAAGGALGVVGESGSGKTTLARMLVGLEQPTEGEIRVAGEPIGGRSAAQRKLRARRIQMIFQDPYQSFDPRLTVREAVEEPLRLHFDLSPDRRRQRVDELCDQVGLSERNAAARPRDLSGGQRQRAAIARALGIEPAVLVLDEAVAALDVSIQAQVLTLLEQIRQDTGVAYVFVSHDLAVVRAVTEQVVVMRLGQVVEEGATEDLLRAPQHPYTQLLLASVPAPGWDPGAVAALSRRLVDGPTRTPAGQEAP